MKALYRIVMLLNLALLPAALCLAQTQGGTPPSARNGSEGGPLLAQPRAARSEKSLEGHQAALKVLTGGPLHFERNAGQFDPQVKFASRGIAHTLFLTSDEAVLVVTGQDGGAADSRWPSGRHSFQRENLRQHVARLKLGNAKTSPEIEGTDELPGRSNYLRGRDKKNWHTNIPHFSRVHYRDVYRGVDWIYYGNEGRLEYDFVVSPGADPGQIALDVSMDEEAKDQAVRIDANGDLVVSADPQTIRFLRPVAFQMVEGQKQLVSANYVMRSPGRVGFELGPYARSQTLVIDPVLTFSTYFGGSEGTAAFGVAVDASGIYVAGQTNSGDLPTTVGAVQETRGGSPGCISSVNPSPCYDAFVTKLTPDGSALVYSTFLGGSSLDGAFGLAVDGNGQAVVVGGTYSTDFPTTDNPLTAFQADINGGAVAACQDSAGSTIDCEDAFLAVLNNLGTSLVYSTYVGGTGTDYASGAAVDASGNAYLTGFTDSDAASFQSTAGALAGGTCTDGTNTYSCGDAFAGKFQYSPIAANPTASRVFLTYIGGTGDEIGNGIAVENSTGNVFVAGGAGANTLGADAFTMIGGFQPSFQGLADGFIAKLNSTGSTVLYSSFLGGSSTDRALEIGLDPTATGKAFVGGYTNSSNFQVKNAYQATRDPSNCSGCLDSFIAKVDTTAATPAGSLMFSTYFGGSGDDAAFGLAVDPSGNVFIAGATSTPATGVTKPFPLMNPLQSAKAGAAGEYDGFVSKFNYTGTTLTLLFSTYVGGTGNFDLPTRVATGPLGEAVAVGITNSYDFPATLGSYQPYHSGAGDDAFVVKIDTAANLPAAAFSDDILFFGLLGVGFTSKKTLTLQNMGTAALNISDISLAGTDPSQFSFTDTCGSSVAAGSKCTIDVTYAPTSNIVHNATLVVADNASGNPHQVGLNGVGVPAPAVTLNPPATLTFPDTMVGTTSAALQITVTNNGGADLNITGVTKVGTAYTVSGCSGASATVTPGNNCVISVTFSPTTGGIITGSVTITDNAPGSPRTVALTGTGIQPDFSMTTADNDETVVNGATAHYTLTITPTNGFNQPISFACTSGVPVRSTCQPPAAVTPDGLNTPVNVTLDVITQSRSAVPPGIVPFTAPPQTAPQGYLPWLLVLLMLTAASLRLAGSRRKATVLLTAALFAALLWTACGGGGGGGGTTPPPKGTPAGDYNITVTATSGSLSKQIVLKLHVS